MFSSFGPLSYKSNLVYALFHRAWYICSSFTDFDIECKFLEKCFGRNGYPSNFFWSRANRIINKLYVKRPGIPFVPCAKVYIPLDYFGTVSDKYSKLFKELVKRFYPQVDIQFAFRNRNTIGSYFRVKDCIPLRLRTGVVYKFTCGVCNDSYIGKTIQHLDSRISQHMGVSEYTYKVTQSSMNLQSSIRDHMKVHNMGVDPNSFSIMTQANSDLDLKVYETLFSHMLKPEICKNETSLTLQLVN